MKPTVHHDYSTLREDAVRVILKMMLVPLSLRKTDRVVQTRSRSRWEAVADLDPSESLILSTRGLLPIPKVYHISPEDAKMGLEHGLEFAPAPKRQIDMSKVLAAVSNLKGPQAPSKITAHPGPPPAKTIVTKVRRGCAGIHHFNKPWD